MLASLFGRTDSHAGRDGRIDALATDVDLARERQALSSLSVSLAADRSVEKAHDTTTAARHAMALIGRKR